MTQNRGSEWRRWEMHMHTPFTQKNDNFTGNTPEEKWDNFYASIDQYIGDGKDPLKAVSAITITDYLSIDNYLKVRDDKKFPSCVELLLPNVELRATPIANNAPLNIHCIFSETVADQLMDRFFAKLTFRYNGTDYSAIRAELIRLGKDHAGNSALSNDEAYKIGLEQYVIPVDTLIELFNNDPDLRSNAIIVVSNKTKDGASGVIAHSDYFDRDISQLDATRRKVYQLSDMIYSSNAKDLSYFLGCSSDNEEIVKQKCGSLMPCIHGSDAHENNKIFEPDQKRYCWIKADLTFEGLKQVLYEPKQRVRISPTYPDSKQDYQIIDYIEITGNNDFSPEKIYLSESLTCIIGGKSTGKSLLLHNIALALDEKQVFEKIETSATNVRRIPELKVYWRDHTSETDTSSRKIVYIPQTYLNRLSDEKEETTEIDTIIQSIVLQNEEVSQIYLTMKEKISTHKQLVSKTILDFSSAVAEKEKILNSKKEIGDKEGIEKEIQKLSLSLESLSKEYNVTEEEIKSFQSALEQIQKITNEIKIINKEYEFISKIDSVLEKRDNLTSSVTIYSETLKTATEKTQKNANTYWLTERNLILKDMNNKIVELEKELEKHKNTELSLKPKMEGNEQIGKISKDIAAEREKLEKIKGIDKKLSIVENSYNNLLSVILGTFTNFRSFYTEYVDAINSKFQAPSEDLEFSVNCVLRAEQLSEKIAGLVDGRSKNRFKSFSVDTIKEDDLTLEGLTKLIDSLLINSEETLQLKKGNTIESALREIFTDWYNLDYIVKMDDDSIENMSPGKKALVLLRLLISLAESKWPILIDQPEDDLDNRSIFDELIQFIKDKKSNRQIIVVTHNANIVLGGDAELVIVANQRGKNSPNKMYKFEYRGGSIENNLPIVDENGKVDVGILNEKGIQKHICEILEGGELAFDLRRNKYHFVKK